MAIEFRCRKCGKLLRTPDDTAGRQAQCPACQELTPIPAAARAEPAMSEANPFGSAGDAEVNPYQSPAAFASETGGGSPFGATGPIVARPLDLNDVLARTWEIFKREWGVCVVAFLIVWAINFPVQLVLIIGTIVVENVVKDQAISIVCNILSNIISSLVGIWLGIGQTIYFLKIARGQKAEFSELFSGGPYFITVLLAGLLFALIFLGGYLLCFVPGIIFALMFSQFYYLIIDRNMGVIESLEASKQIMQGNKLTLFLVGLVSGLGALAVMLLTCFIGLLAVVPFLTLLYVMIYLTVTGQPTVDRSYPQSTT